MHKNFPSYSDTAWILKILSPLHGCRKSKTKMENLKLKKDKIIKKTYRIFSHISISLMLSIDTLNFFQTCTCRKSTWTRKTCTNRRPYFEYFSSADMTDFERIPLFPNSSAPSYLSEQPTLYRKSTHSPNCALLFHDVTTQSESRCEGAKICIYVARFRYFFSSFDHPMSQCECIRHFRIYFSSKLHKSSQTLGKRGRSSHLEGIPHH